MGGSKTVPGSERNLAKIPQAEAPQIGAAFRKRKDFFVSNVTLRCVHGE